LTLLKRDVVGETVAKLEILRLSFNIFCCFVNFRIAALGASALMRPIVTDAAWFVSVSVCLLDTAKSPAKTDEPIEVPFGK